VNSRPNRNLLGERPGASEYLDDAYYDRLVKIAAEWSAPGSPIYEPERTIVRAVLYRECRLLDDGDFEQWLDLFVENCVYWIPGSSTVHDPRREITWELHDRRRLEDRIARLRTGAAFAQIPPTRTRHCLSNLEIWRAGADELRARTNLTIHTFRHGISATLPCMAGYVLRQQPDNGWLIEVKQINLLDAEYAQGNISFLL
jgi:3-phenylpropionate/cinnamic acid dioxygenase small subunit